MCKLLCMKLVILRYVLQRWEVLKNYFQSQCCVAETVKKFRKIIFGRNEAPGVRKFIENVLETDMFVDNKRNFRARAVRACA